MRRVWSLAVLIAILSGCAFEVQTQVIRGELLRGKRAVNTVDQRQVEAFVRSGQLVGAREYLTRLGVGEAEIQARIQAARDVLAVEGLSR